MFDNELFGYTEGSNGFALSRMGVRARVVLGNNFMKYFQFHSNYIGFQTKIYQAGVVSGSHENEFATGDAD
jgi:hypothetical protein